MSRIIAFPLARPKTRDAGEIPHLAARLARIEESETEDEAVMDLVIDAETLAISALAAAPAASYAEAAVKLAAVVRRAGTDGEGYLAFGELALLKSALDDILRLEQSAATAAHA